MGLFCEEYSSRNNLYGMGFKFLTVLLCLLVLKSALSAESVFEEWRLYKRKYGKMYPNIRTDFSRMQIFAKNLLEIRKHNELYAAGLTHYKKEINQFTDLSKEELSSFTLSYKSHNFPRSKHRLIENVKDDMVGSSGSSIPKTVDWRKEGMVTSVKDQKNCGSCWAFAVAGALEGFFAKNNRSKEPISVQNLIDCSSKYGNHGCKGGNIIKAFEYIHDNGGIDVELKYSYEETDNKPCRYNSSSSPGSIKKLKLIDRNENSLKIHVAKYGPVAAAMDATNLHHYKEGIYSDPECDSDNINHAVLIVGYDTDDKTGQDFWIVKNSWGKEWGEKGYFHLRRNHGDECGISIDASVPIL